LQSQKKDLQQPNIRPSALDELRYRTVAELASGSMHEYSVSPEGEFILDWVVGAERVFGVSDAQLKRLDSNSFLCEEDMPALYSRMRAYLRGEAVDFTTRIVRADGATRWIRVANRPLKDPATGRVVKMIGFCTDVSEQKEAATAVRQSEFRYRTVAQLTPGFVYEAAVDDDGDIRIIWASPNAAQFLGCSVEEFNSLGWRHFVPADQVEQRLERRARTLRGEATHDEYPMRTADGEIRWIELKTQPMRDPDGRVRGFLGVANDITARRATEELLRSQAIAFEKMQEGVVLVSDAGIVRVCNPAFAALFGRSADSVVGSYVGSLVTEPPMTLSVAEIEARTGGFALPLQRQLRIPGRELTVEATMSPIMLRGERFWLAVLTDISERVQLEREVLEISNREQQRIGSDLHDGLGQELTGVALLLRGLANTVEKQTPALVPVVNEIAKLVNDAIFTTRSLARGLTPITFDRGGLASALMDLARRSQGTYGARVQCTADPEVQDNITAAAAMHLYRLAQEGIANAARHARATNIEITLERVDLRGSLTIADDGDGFATLTEYSGMGLRIMRYRAAMIDGELEVTSSAGRGTRIKCEFPTGAGPQD
jgi:PAS domain S-box-containing protein